MRVLIAAEYEDEEAYIKAVFNGVAGMLSQRDSYGVGIKMFGTVIAYGPFYDIGTAKKYAGEFAGAMRDVTAYTARLKAPESLKPKEV